MDQPDHAHLGIILKNWAAQVRTPGQTRARLLSLAARVSPEADLPYVHFNERIRAYQSFNWSGYLLTWNPDHSFQTNLPVVCILV